MSPQVQRIVILGGGTAGWMTAAALSYVLAPRKVAITLIESDEIGTVGVGEATLPHIRFFNQRIGLDEPELMRATKATMKLGIEFTDWCRKGDAYIHPFGDYGQPAGGIDFIQIWSRLRAAEKASRICDYSLPVVMAEAGRFAFPSDDESSVLSTFSYAYQFDAGLYAKYLRKVCEGRGVRRVEGRVTSVHQNPESGHVESLERRAVTQNQRFPVRLGCDSLLSGGGSWLRHIRRICGAGWWRLLNGATLGRRQLVSLG